MVILDLKLDNFLYFNNFHVNFTYPRKILDSSIDNEYLKDFPNFRYKKVNILLGANASGKTSLGRVLFSIIKFINDNSINELLGYVLDREKEASFSIDFVPDKKEVYRLIVKIPVKEENFEYKLSDMIIVAKKIAITSRDSYESCSKKLDILDMNIELSDIPRLGYRFASSVNSKNNVAKIDSNNKLHLKVRENLLKTLDNSILRLEVIKNAKNSYIIVKDKTEIIVQDGEPAKRKELSTGTIEGIDIAEFVLAVMEHRNGFYYCDEKFSFIHNEVEKAILSLMIDRLGENEQLFFTTHNIDIATMNLPKHSFTFMRKYNDELGIRIDCISASEKLKKSTDSVKNALDNDLFMTQPNLNYILAKMQECFLLS